MMLEEVIKKCGNCQFFCEHWCEKKKRDDIGRCFKNLIEEKPCEMNKENNPCNFFKLRNSE